MKDRGSGARRAIQCGMALLVGSPEKPPSLGSPEAKSGGLSMLSRMGQGLCATAGRDVSHSSLVLRWGQKKSGRGAGAEWRRSCADMRSRGWPNARPAATFDGKAKNRDQCLGLPDISQRHCSFLYLFNCTASDGRLLCTCQSFLFCRRTSALGGRSDGTPTSATNPRHCCTVSTHRYRPIVTVTALRPPLSSPEISCKRGGVHLSSGNIVTERRLLRLFWLSSHLETGFSVLFS